MSVKETTDCLYLIKVITLNVLREVEKDGFQPSDMLAFLKSDEFSKALTQAIDGADKVAGEITSLGAMDGIALARYGYGMWLDIVQEIRAVEAAKKA